MALILVVDDSDSMRDLLCLTLRTAGHQVVDAENGRKALELAEQRRFELVFTDLRMPEMDGVSLLRALRGTPGYGSTPIVVLTTSTDPEERQVARAAGATGWMVKPFGPDALLTVVNKLLAKTKPSAA